MQKKIAGAEQKGEDSQSRRARTGQSHGTARTAQNKTARTGLPEQDY
jgi:hypothetical protein